MQRYSCTTWSRRLIWRELGLQDASDRGKAAYAVPGPSHSLRSTSPSRNQNTPQRITTVQFMTDPVHANLNTFRSAFTGLSVETSCRPSLPDENSQALHHAATTASRPSRLAEEPTAGLFASDCSQKLLLPRTFVGT